MSRLSTLIAVVLVAMLLPFANDGPAGAHEEEVEENAPPRVIAWNDLGMHCLDPDFSVFSILPPFNTINAQLTTGGKLRGAGGGFTLTYEAVADPDGSINSTSIGKTNFWNHEDDLFGVNLPLDVGLTGHAMPGLTNTPQAMPYVGPLKWFQGEGIPLTPVDDAGNKNPYPLMRIVARDQSGAVIATTVTSVPNSQELTCHLCHASGANPYARPTGGWEHDADPLRDDRLNILRLHDERHLGDPIYTAALAAAGYDPLGLHHTAVVLDRAILCATCHGSNALPGTGMAGISAMTAAIHAGHSDARSPDGLRLDDDVTRNSCFTCHPGFDTQCLRGAMGKAIADDGDFAMHCQSCHGDMADVGDPARVGWLEQPDCQSCHTGTATNNSGQIRFTSVFDSNGNPHVPASSIFATEPDVPQTGFNLYRFSEGHGNMQCAACHGPPHAIYPTAFANDNQQSLILQGHAGTITECATCHGDLEDNQLMMGPHGMHPQDEEWATDKHGDHANANLSSCMACHGSNLRGTELSRAHGDRSYQTQFGQKNFWRGFEVGCYDCHLGPNDDDANTNSAPSVVNSTVATPNDTDLVVPLTGTDPDGTALTFRIVSQPEFRTGTVAIMGATATFIPEPGFIGATSFTYGASDGDTWSNLGTVTVNVGPPACSGEIEEYGFGSPSSGDHLCHLGAAGCAEPGGTVTFALDGALGGSYALVIVGATRDHFEALPGWVLHVGGIVSVTDPIPLGGAGPGAGGFTASVTFPPGTPPLDITLQAFVADPAAPATWATSNGLELRVR